MKLFKELIRPFIIIMLVSIVYGVAFNWCYRPNHIAYGGVTGIAQIINYITKTPSIGVIIMVINIPMFILAWKSLGKKFLILSLYSVWTTSMWIDIVDVMYEFEPMEPLLGCIYGGMMVGMTLGVVIRMDASTGGTELAARLLRRKIAWLPVGRLMLMLDLGVIAAAAVVFGDIDSAMYGLVALYICSIVMDQVIYGMDKSQVAYIISDHSQEIAQAITNDMRRGVTLLDGKGGWSGEAKEIIMCAFKHRQTVQVSKLVKSIDPNAFLIVCPAYEVMGQGFQSNKP